MHDGISFEQLGKRAIVLCTDPFEVTARNIARMMGLPDYPFVMVEHPIGSRTPAEIDMPPAHDGQHTREVLADWGVPAERVDALIESGAVRQA